MTYDSKSPTTSQTYGWGAVASMLGASVLSQAASKPGIKAIAFDAFPIFDPRTYQLGVDTLKLKREEIAFAAFAGWDVAGAKWFGYPTFWVNRAGFPNEELGVTADGAGKNIVQLVDFIKS